MTEMIALVLIVLAAYAGYVAGRDAELWNGLGRLRRMEAYSEARLESIEEMLQKLLEDSTND